MANLAMTSKLKMTPYGLLNKEQYKEMVSDSIERGLSYEEAGLWREAKLENNINFLVVFGKGSKRLEILFIWHWIA